MASELDGEGCATPEDAGSADEQEKDLACILCGRKMSYQADFRTSVCLNEEHGVLAFYAPDSCYFTSRREVGVRFAKEGRKFHMIESEVLKMMDVDS